MQRNKPIYVAAYHQSKFGKLGAKTLAEIVADATTGVLGEVKAEAAAIDLGSVASACSLTLNEQGLCAGLVAAVPGLAGKPFESVENACASGGQAVLSVIYRLLAGEGEVGLALGFEKMRGPDGKMDGKAVGRALGLFAHPDDRAGKTFVFPHIFAEVMDEYMKASGASERDLAAIAVAEYANAQSNPWAQMRGVTLTLEQATNLDDRNRRVIEGLPLKTYDCSQISDGHAALLLATAEGLQRLGVARADAVEIAGYAQATDPLPRAGRDVLRPAGARRAMGKAYAMAGLSPADVNVAEVHDCFTVMGAIGVEVLGKADAGRGAAYWTEGKAAVDGDCAVNTSGGLIAKGHPVGATGVAMVGWAAQQLLGRAPAPLQVKAPRAAATFNIGGPICASVCTVLRRP